MKRYILKKDHPYAKAGTIVEEVLRGSDEMIVQEYKNVEIHIPYTVQGQWLEEVKEEPTCSPEFANELKYMIDYWLSDAKPNSLVVVKKWIDDHISYTKPLDY